MDEKSSPIQPTETDLLIAGTTKQSIDFTPAYSVLIQSYIRRRLSLSTQKEVLQEKQDG